MSLIEKSLVWNFQFSHNFTVTHSFFNINTGRVFDPIKHQVLHTAVCPYLQTWVIGPMWKRLKTFLAESMKSLPTVFTNVSVGCGCHGEKFSYCHSQKVKWKLDNFPVNFINMEDSTIHLILSVANNTNESSHLLEPWIVCGNVHTDGINHAKANLPIPQGCWKPRTTDNASRLLPV